MRPVVFDTDIGSDVDDILALTLLARAPELKLLGVTTVYGDTQLRARVAAVTCKLLERNGVHIVPGASQTLTKRQVYWAGHEGYGIPGLGEAKINNAQPAHEYIAKLAEETARELEILATGPLTNIALAITSAPESLRKIKRLYLMGGAFWLDRAEHNIKCDPEAATIVFDSGLPVTAIGLDLTLRVWMDEKDLQQIAQAGGGVGPMLEGQVRRWWAFRNTDRSNPHDPLAALAMVRPDLFFFENWDVAIEKRGVIEGFTRTTNPGAGRVSLGSDVFVRRVEKEIIRRIVS
jgi:inosine-uridine nucleoside N-ribohydrolase